MGSKEEVAGAGTGIGDLTAGQEDSAAQPHRRRQALSGDVPRRAEKARRFRRRARSAEKPGGGYGAGGVHLFGGTFGNVATGAGVFAAPSAGKAGRGIPAAGKSV